MRCKLLNSKIALHHCQDFYRGIILFNFSTNILYTQFLKQVYFFSNQFHKSILWNRPPWISNPKKKWMNYIPVWIIIGWSNTNLYFLSIRHPRWQPPQDTFKVCVIIVFVGNLRWLSMCLCFNRLSKCCWYSSDILQY
jgi:hypothetical protein